MERHAPAQVAYTADGHFLLSGARQDADLICWDLRVAGGGAGDGAGERAVLYRLPRDTAGTNQRVAFSLEPCGRHLATGGCNGAVKVLRCVLGAAKGGVVQSHPCQALCGRERVRACRVTIRAGV